MSKLTSQTRRWPRVLEDLSLPDLDALQLPKLDEEFQDLIKDDRKADSMLKNDKNLAKVQAALRRAIGLLDQVIVGDRSHVREMMITSQSHPLMIWKLYSRSWS